MPPSLKTIPALRFEACKKQAEYYVAAAARCSAPPSTARCSPAAAAGRVARGGAAAQQQRAPRRRNGACLAARPAAAAARCRAPSSTWHCSAGTDYRGGPGLRNPVTKKRLSVQKGRNCLSNPVRKGRKRTFSRGSPRCPSCCERNHPCCADKFKKRLRNAGAPKGFFSGGPPVCADPPREAHLRD